MWIEESSLISDHSNELVSRSEVGMVFKRIVFVGDRCGTVVSCKLSFCRNTHELMGRVDSDVQRQDVLSRSWAVSRHQCAEAHRSWAAIFLSGVSQAA